MDTSFTTTPGVPECTLDPDVARAINAEAAADKTQINGVDIPKEYWPTNPAGYVGSKFTLTQFGLSETITVKKTTTTTVHSTTTETVAVPKVASAKCDYKYVPLPTHLSISPFLHYISLCSVYLCRYCG
jgi:chitinase